MLQYNLQCMLSDPLIARTYYICTSWFPTLPKSSTASFGEPSSLARIFNIVSFIVKDGDPHLRDPLRYSLSDSW